MRKLKFAVFGAGFWANYQIPAWYALEGIELVALCDRIRSKAEAMAKKFGVPRVYDNADELLTNESLDFIDIITDVDTHPLFVEKAAEWKLDVICQKPMGANFEIARQMVDTCREARVRFFIHENFRWQAPLRQLKAVLNSGAIGEPFKARVSFLLRLPRV